MGVLKFRLVPPDLAIKRPDLRKAYVTGPDRTPGRSSVELRPGLLAIHREATESGRVHIPWPVEGHGEPVVGTATLVEQPGIYDLAVELARGKLNDVMNQTADWSQMGLLVQPEINAAITSARKALAHAVTNRDRPEENRDSAANSLRDSSVAARLLVLSYTRQLLARRLDHARPLPTFLACGLDGVTKSPSWSAPLPKIFQAGRARMSWSQIAPDEGKKRWEDSDAQVAWARKHGMSVAAGPLVELRPGAIPDWLWLWERDYDEIQTQATDHVRQVLTRYGSKVSTWHLIHRVAGHEILGLSEEEQIRLTAQILQTAKRLVPEAALVVDFDRPWAEWMATSRFQLGPLHLADSLTRADLGLGAIGLEIAPSYSSIGSHARDLLDFSRLLDLFALVNLPLHVSFAAPSSAAVDPLAMADVKTEPNQWPLPPTEKSQRDWASAWCALAAAKPFVRSVTWLQSIDSVPHVFPHAGLIRADGTRKPLLDWFAEFRASIS
jgi:hypothetical protein